MIRPATIFCILVAASTAPRAGLQRARPGAAALTGEVWAAWDDEQLAAILTLIDRIAWAEERFHERLEDLAALDVPEAARILNAELVAIELEADRFLRIAHRTADHRLFVRADSVLKEAGFARDRLRKVEAIGSTAHAFGGLLARMRAALDAGRPDRALELYWAERGESRAEAWPSPLVGRLLAVLDETADEARGRWRPVAR